MLVDDLVVRYGISTARSGLRAAPMQLHSYIYRSRCADNTANAPMCISGSTECYLSAYSNIWSRRSIVLFAVNLRNIKHFQLES